jgi:hypothetical protein
MSTYTIKTRKTSIPTEDRWDIIDSQGYVVRTVSSSYAQAKRIKDQIEAKEGTDHGYDLF